ncbi:MAG TPA: hypothetical protein VJ915_05365 [Balneolaceae bacterium]|nr:hypothetical protein [Balneolaceae bacterium]
MKESIIALFVSMSFLIAGCGSEQDHHSHGEDGDHTHEAPAQQSSTDDSDAIRIGGAADSLDAGSEHSHDEDGDHTHEEEHSHDEDSTHSHVDDEHSH